MARDQLATPADYLPGRLSGEAEPDFGAPSLVLPAVVCTQIRTGARNVIRIPDTGGRPSVHARTRVALLPARSGPLECYVLIESVEREQLANLTPAEARREGFESVASFGRYWRHAFGGIAPYEPGIWVWRIQLVTTSPRSES